jgi:rhodanese-related sulfurtransferase
VAVAIATVRSRVDPEAFGEVLRRAGSVVLDVRSPGEFAAVHVPGSYNFPLDVLPACARDVVERVRGPITVVCAQGVRSEEAGRVLSAAGGEVQVLEGGLQAWQSCGGEVARGEGRWAMERQVRLVAGSVVVAGVVGSVVVPKAKWIAAAIGAGLSVSALTNTCTMAKALGYLPYNRSGPRFDLTATLESLASA